MKGPKGPAPHATEAHVFLDWITNWKSSNINKEKFKQVEEVLKKYIEGNRDMIKPYGASGTQKTFPAAGVVASSNGAAGIDKVAPARSMGFDPFDGLALSEFKQLKPPYICSVYCEQLYFKSFGGCPTCNLYWKPMQRRDGRVDKIKHKGMDAVIFKGEVDPEALRRHYAEVKKNYPDWKVENDIPIPPNSITEVGPVPVDYQLPRPAHEQEPWDDTKRYTPAPPMSETVERVSFDCSDVCMTGKFLNGSGCPTCREFWDGIKLRDPRAKTTKFDSGGAYLANKAGSNYEAYVIGSYMTVDLQAHYKEIHSRYPSWPITRDQKAHISKGTEKFPTLPQALRTKNPDEILLPTKAPYNPAAHYKTPYSSEFSWPQHAGTVTLDRNVLAFWRDKLAWLPAKILGSCSEKDQFCVRFYPFDSTKNHYDWLPATDIKLVVWAPSHTTGAQRDESYVDRAVMALGHGTGWKSAKITGLGLHTSKYEVRFDDPDEDPDRLYWKELFPYEFCLLLDETLPAATGEEDIVPVPFVVSQASDVIGERVIALEPDTEHTYRLGKISNVSIEKMEGSVVFDGETDAVPLNDFKLVIAVPLISKEHAPQYFVVGLSCWTWALRKDTKEREWVRGIITGFKIKEEIWHYWLKIYEKDADGDFTSFIMKESTDVFVEIAWRLAGDKTDAADAADAADQINPAMEVDELVDAAGQVDLNQK